MNRFAIYNFKILLIFFLFSCSQQEEQSSDETPVSSDTLSVVQTAETPEPEVPDTSELELQLIGQGLVDIQSLDPEIVVELRYSTENNFLGADVYGELDRCYIQPEAGEKLVRAQQLLRESHPELSLLVFDCARPRSVQWKMWNILDKPDKRNYVADPREGSVHNYGCAVDLSLTHRDSGEVDMGTPFDYFGPLGMPQMEAAMLAEGKLSEAQVQNRQILRDVMKKAGFYPILTEWWHFNAFLTPVAMERYEIIE